MFCEKCGRQIADNSLFCEYCGAAVYGENNYVASHTAPIQPISHNIPPKKNKRPTFSGKQIRFGLIILALMIVGLNTVNKRITLIKSPLEKSPQELSAEDFPETTIPADIQKKNDEQLDEYLNQMKDQKSDIEGWSKYDKYKYGLNTEDGSDTDKDGLTDQEELEIYGSDPLKASTAGDLYTDGEKVANDIDPLEKVEYDGDKRITSPTGEVSVFMQSPWDRTVSFVDRTEEYKQDGAELLHWMPDSFYLAYEVCQYDGDTIEVDLDMVSKTLNIPADDLDVEAHATRGYEYKSKRSGNVVTLTFKGVESFDSGVGMKAYDLFIVDKTSFLNNFSILNNDNNDEVARMGIEQNEYDRKYCGLIVNDTIACNFLPGIPMVYCSENATEEEIKAIVNMAATIHLNEPFYKRHPRFASALERNVFNRNDLVVEDTKTIETLTHLFEMISGEKGLITNPYDLSSKKLFRYCTPDIFMNSYEQALISENEEDETQDPNFGITDEFSFSNFDTLYLINVTKDREERCGVCAGLAQIAAEVYNNGYVQLPASEYSATVWFKDNQVTQTLAYDITQYSELDTFYDRYLSDYRANRGGKLEYNSVYELNPDEHEFLKMVTCYWRRVNDIQNASVRYEDTLLANRSGFLLDWETVENATRYLDDHEILMCATNINNTYDQGHEVNLVGYERGTKVLQDGHEYETVTFDVYDCNYPKCFLKLECYKMDTVDGKNAMMYQFNTCSKDYYASFMVDDYEIGETKGSKCIKFAIFNTEGQCLNIKL